MCCISLLGRFAVEPRKLWLTRFHATISTECFYIGSILLVVCINCAFFSFFFFFFFSFMLFCCYKYFINISQVVEVWRHLLIE